MKTSRLRLYHQLQMAAHLVQKAADRATLEAAGITTAQAAVLAILDGGKARRQKEVAALLGVNESAMTSMCNKLIASGHVSREPDENDSRAWRLGLTAQGGEAVRLCSVPFGEINRRMEACLGSSRMEVLSGELQILIDEFRLD